MKKATIFAFALLFSTLCAAQHKGGKNQVPAAVKSAFATQFPTVNKVKWEKEGEHFEAEYKLNKTEYSAVFDAQGTLLETEMEIPVSQLPSDVAAYMQANYAGKKIKEAAKITNSKGVATYEAEIKGMDLKFDSNGKFLKAAKD